MKKKNKDFPGRKFDGGKIQWHLLFCMVRALIEVVKVLMGGADKYKKYNWMKGIDFSRVKDASDRHGMSWWNGEDLDPEWDLQHMAHRTVNDLFLLHYMLDYKKYKKFDDRPKRRKSNGNY